MAIKFNPKEQQATGRGAEKPPYAPNVVNQTVTYGGATWKGNPGSDWTMQSSNPSSSSGSSVDQLGQANAFTQSYQNAIANQPSYQDLWKNIASGFNYPGLAQNATNLQNEYFAIPQQYTSVQPGANQSGPQRENAMQLAQWRLAPQVNAATNQAQTAGQLTAAQLAAAQAQQQKELLPYLSQQQLLQGILGNITGILQSQIGQQYKITPQGQFISTGAVPGTVPGAAGQYASNYSTFYPFG